MARIPKPSGRKQREVVLASNYLHLIYSEGSKTEPLYVENIKTVIKQNFKDKEMPIILEVVPFHGMGTSALVEFAEKDVANKISQGDKIDHVWIFYDKDSFPQDSFDNTHKRITSKNIKTEQYLNDDGDYTDINNIRWHSIWSNECFEIWVLLHFIYIEAALSRDLYIPKINEYLGDITYSKDLTNLYELLKEKGNIELAIRFAKRLAVQNGLNNPSTGVYQFIEHLKLYLKI